MTKNEIDNYSEGYNEHRLLVRFALQQILGQKCGHKKALADYLIKLASEIEADHWREIQKERPGITLEEYEATLEEDANRIHAEYYNKNGYLKPRLIK